MRKIKNTTTMIERLNDKFQGLRAQNESYFSGNPQPSQGIWLKGIGALDSEYIDNLTSIDIDKGIKNGFIPMPSVLIKDYLEVNDWFIQPYDSGTLMAYR